MTPQEFKQARETAGLTKEKLGTILGTYGVDIVKFERGAKPIPKSYAERLLQLAHGSDALRGWGVRPEGCKVGIVETETPLVSSQPNKGVRTPPENVIAIYKLKGKMKAADVAKRFNRNHSTIVRIWRKEIYKDLLADL